MFRKFRSLPALILFFCLALSPGADAAGPSASGTVERFQTKLLEVMKAAEKLSVQQRFDRLGPTAVKSFHFPLMIQIASGKYWKGATASEQIELIKAFKHMSVSTLATLFDGYSGEVFKLSGEKPGPQKTLLVMTKLVKSDKSTVNITYVTKKIKDDWWIIDIVVDTGISELMVRRSEYNLVLKNKGIPGLISLLNRRANELTSN